MKSSRGEGRLPSLDLSAAAIKSPRTIEEKTPRSPTAAAATETPRRRWHRKYESLRICGSFTQDVQDGVSRIIQNAITAGQTRAVVQTLRLANQFSFVYRGAENEDGTHLLHDARTLAPLTKVRGRVRFAAAGMQLVEWLQREQQLEVRACTLRTGETLAGHDAVADWVQLVVIFVPVRPLPEPGSKMTLAALFNTQYADRAASSPETWAKRMAMAQSCGATYYCAAVLYSGQDYGVGAEDDICLVRHAVWHPTMETDNDGNGITLSPHLAPLVRWIHQIGYTWALARRRNQKWALLVVWLDPLNTYL